MVIEIRTNRLLLRSWRTSDLAPWAAMNADPQVREHLGPGNLRSQAVMRRIGMTRDPSDDFDDPTVPDGPLKRSALFRIARPRT